MVKLYWTLVVHNGTMMPNHQKQLLLCRQHFTNLLQHVKLTLGVNADASLQTNISLLAIRRSYHYTKVLKSISKHRPYIPTP